MNKIARVERGISARKSRVQTISAAIFAVIAGLFASVAAAFALRRRENETEEAMLFAAVAA